MIFRAQRINADRRFVRIVLAPIHEHFATAQIFLHLGHDRFGKFPFQTFGDPMREIFGLFVSHRRVQRHENLQAFGPGRLGKTLQLEFLKKILQPQRDAATRRKSAGGPGSRSKASAVGVSSAGARCKNVCSSRSARLAAQTRAGKVSMTQ